MHLIRKSNEICMIKSRQRCSSQLILLRLKSKLSENNDSEYIQCSTVPTMHFQTSLPRLPIPKLEETCSRYLKAQKPLLSSTEFSKTESCVKDFLHSDGPTLQAELQHFDSKNRHTSYISEPWSDMYLRDRKPLPINYNPALIFTPETDAKYNDQLVKSTNLVISSMRFLKSLRAGLLEPEVFHLNPKKSNTQFFRRFTGLLPETISWYGAYLFNAYPLDMSQYHNLFNSTRIPLQEKDEISQDTLGRHLLVSRKGHFYTFDVIDKNGYIASPKQVAANLNYILNDTRSCNENSVGHLTASERNIWALMRSHLSAENSQALAKIDSAVFALAFEDNESSSEVEMNTGTANYRKLMRTFLYGDPANRWFDKSFSLIVTNDGYAGINFEHSWGDGVAVLRYFEDIKRDIEKRPSFHPKDVEDGEQHGMPSAKVEKLEFQLDSKMLEVIKEERLKFQQWTDQLDLDYLMSEGFGKQDCKKYAVSPDAMMQLSFQLAFYKQEQRASATYESCSTAAFKHGRTETIRPCTQQTSQFCSSIMKAQSSGMSRDSIAELKRLIVDCSRVHGQLTKEAAMGQGFDRHMFALNRISQHLSSSRPSIFQDSAYAKINHNILSTSTLSSPFVLGGGFGPVVQDGYGIGYMIKDKTIGTVVTSYKSGRRAQEFTKNLESSISDIITILSA